MDDLAEEEVGSWHFLDKRVIGTAILPHTVKLLYRGFSMASSREAEEATMLKDKEMVANEDNCVSFFKYVMNQLKHH